MQTTLTVTEAAEKLRVCEDTVYTMVRRKQIPHFRVRRRIFFRLESLDAWMKQQEAEIKAIAASNA
ncbi:helix-turn-helix domain-containing protein [Paenibacillus sp. LMG 31456]|uniref:Helix-turn-helix domain-containing protein n=1 Tax=Paenibacillus foliorum TaxID=2654974 RepID=A0A972K286_9BACL|nr:helix-turn-helix domain-containing protein [Paenibacillus foliorum]NOU95620.1 helix-turn-helix domain-containing protein [Paenibacillus foliorum]